MRALIGFVVVFVVTTFLAFTALSFLGGIGPAELLLVVVVGVVVAGSTRSVAEAHHSAPDRPRLKGAVRSRAGALTARPSP
jgi:hypothetical protein